MSGSCAFIYVQPSNDADLSIVQVFPLLLITTLFILLNDL